MLFGHVPRHAFDSKTGTCNLMARPPSFSTVPRPHVHPQCFRKHTASYNVPRLGNACRWAPPGACTTCAASGAGRASSGWPQAPTDRTAESSTASPATDGTWDPGATATGSAQRCDASRDASEGAVQVGLVCILYRGLVFESSSKDEMAVE